MKRFGGFSVLVVLTVSLSFVIGGLGTAQSSEKMAKDLAKKIASGRGDLQGIIVQTYGPLTQKDVDDVRGGGGKVTRVYANFNAYAATMPLPAIKGLLHNPHVKWISPDRAARSYMAWATVATRTDAAWTDYGVSGAGVGIAVLDSGVARHDDLNQPGRLVAWQDFVTNTPDFTDDNGHGTHVAGIAAGNGAASVSGNYSPRFYGVASGANVIGVKALDATGQGFVSDIIAGIDWCITNKATYNIRVMNLSIGHPVAESYTTDPLCQACERAWTAGIVVVVAAGNRGRSDLNNPDSPPAYGTIDSPGNDPYVITVGATNTRSTMDTLDDVMASYSGHAPTLIDHILKPDLVAPGNKVVSLLSPGQYLDTALPLNKVSPSTYSGSGVEQYYVLSGTSMAAPMVAGAAALMLERDPTLTPNTVKARLMASARKLVRNRDGTVANMFIRGAGQLDVAAALGRGGHITSGHAWSPVVIRRSEASGLFQLSTEPLGGSNIIWGDRTLWSKNIIWGDNIIWADNIIWGDDTMWGENILWSDDAVWSNDLTISDNAGSVDGLFVIANGDGQ